MRHLPSRLAPLCLLALGACEAELGPSPSGFDNGNRPAERGDPKLPPPSQVEAPPAPPAETKVGRGVLDATYGSNGKVAFKSTVAGVDAVLLDDNKTVVVARSPDGKMLALAKYDTAGAVDKTFGLTGATPIAPSGPTWRGTSAVASGGGRLFVLGFSTEERGAEVRAYLANGKPDTTFGADGTSLLKFPAGTLLNEGSLAYASSDRLIFGGSSAIAAGYSDLVLGSVGADGKDAKSHEVYPGTATDVRGEEGATTGGVVSAVVPIGKDVWVAGSYEVKLATGPNEVRPTLRVTRSDGSTTAIAFSGTGSLRKVWDAGKGQVAAVGVIGQSFVLARASVEGAVDQTLSPSGLTTLAAPCEGQVAELADAAPGPDGGFYTLARCENDAAAISLFDASGTLVKPFGTTGVTKITLPSAARLRRQTDGKLLVVGTKSMARITP